MKNATEDDHRRGTRRTAGAQQEQFSSSSNSSSHQKNNNSNKSPFVVLGVALIVDQLGKGARMVLRYPTAPVRHTDNTDHHHDKDDISARENDLFFRLPSRQMAKLFRPKPALCGQPMTLSVGGTVFCCCATLMGGGGDTTTDHRDGTTETTSTLNAAAAATEEERDGNVASSSDANNNSNNNPEGSNLVLFSVIVALAPQSHTSVVLPLAGWAEGVAAGSGIEPPTQVRTSRSSLSMLEGKLGMPSQDEGNNTSASFRSIRRIHISLARLCRVLEREERRCRYVSIQSDRFRKIRSEAQKVWKDQQFNQAMLLASSSSLQQPGSSSTMHNSSPGTLPVANKPSSTASDRKRGHHRKVASFGRGDLNNLNDRSTINISTQAGDDIVPEIEQEVMESIMASKPNSEELTSSDPQTYDHSGNLARELAQVYHALGRNDDDFPPSPSDLLTGKSGIVYVNRHIAVAIEALSPSRGVFDDSKPTLHPYHTLLYPQASPSEMLDSLKMTGPGAPRRLQQFLLMANPQKSINELAVDANLPLPKAMEIASYLVEQGVCLISPVVSHSSRLACTSVDAIREATLSFSQTFGPTVHLFAVVSFLTQSGRTLGDSITTLTASRDLIATQLRRSMEASLEHHGSLHSRPTRLDTTASLALSPTGLYSSDTVPTAAQDELWRIEKLEELLYQMATWLRSRQVLHHLIDFVVARASFEPSRDDPTKSDSSEPTEKKVDGASGGTATSVDEVFRELMDLRCLAGRSSVQYCSWRLGLEPSRFRALVARCSKLRLVTREPAEGDNW